MSKLNWDNAKRPAGGYTKNSTGTTRKPTERQQLIKYAEAAIFACCRTIPAKQPELSRDDVFNRACEWMTTKLLGQGHYDAAVIVGNIKAKRK